MDDCARFHFSFYTLAQDASPVDDVVTSGQILSPALT